MDEEREILVIRYLAGELQGEELLRFEALLQSDEELQLLVKEYSSIGSGIQSFERKNVKAEIGAIIGTVSPADIQQYPPQSNSFFKFIKKLFKTVIGLGVVAGAVSVVLIGLNKFPVKNKYTEKVKQTLITVEQATGESVHLDTVFHTVYVTDTIVTTGTVKGFAPEQATPDTIVVYENELNGRTVQQAIRDKMKIAAHK